MLPYSMIAGGNFVIVDPTLAFDIELQAQNPPDLIWMRNRTAFGVAAEGTQIVEIMWHNGMAQGTAQGITQTTATGALAATLDSVAGISTNGISTYDTANPPTFSPLALTAITGSAGTFVVSMANTGSISVGDYVRLYGTTGELQIAGYTFQVTAVTSNVSITLGYMASGANAAGNTFVFAADATAGFVQKFIPNRMYPRWRWIANITRAAQAKIYFTEKNDFTPGEIVGLRVNPIVANPAEPTMTEVNNLDVRVLSVVNTATESSIVVDLDTSGFTAFKFPTSAVAAAAGSNPAVVIPSSSGVVPFNGSATVPQQPPGTNLQDAFDNRNTRIIHIGAPLFVNAAIGDIYDWYAMKFDQFNNL